MPIKKWLEKPNFCNRRLKTCGRTTNKANNCLKRQYEVCESPALAGRVGSVS